MKNILPLLALFLIMTTTTCAQNQQLKNKVAGEWLLQIDLTKSIAEETHEDDELLEKAILSGLSGFIETILDAVEIKFLIHKDGTYSVVVKN